ncbi:LysM repeat-containing protein [Pedococcus dokdonensis]|uniref:LysM repeat-containing protein n=1 Tax=Pedococcus dokdonensis TaxID=443156 RepID=A0A1H0MXI7_9MICO|nr:lytic transglycosylase domain-containing protein [Pedococcus dokdonensis]SDO85188.1 LysM repeat-containing protein [Pedococcus dokdonensis]
MSPVIAPAALPQTPLAAPVAVVQKAKPAPHGWTTYTVRAGDTLAAIADRTGTTTGVLASRNHLAHGGNHLSIGQRLSVPKTAAQARAEAARARAAAAARAAAIRRATYVVRPGDTLSHIAARKGVSLAALLKANHLSTRSVLQVGQKVRIPGSGAASAHRATGASKAISTTTYRVRNGDTLSAIAARTKTPLATVYRLNRLGARSVIHPGQLVKVRGTTPAATRRAGSAAYRVRSGDTLSGIAVKHGTRLAALLKTNHLSARSVIHPGQRLRVPAKPAKSATSANTFAGRTYPSSTVNAANRNRSALARTSVPSRSQTKAMIVATARRHGVDPRLALAVGWQESGWNQRQVSVANAIGVMQVIPSSGQWASEMAGRKLNLLRTQDNITAGVVILRSLTRSAKNLDQAIAGYYQGLYSVQQHGMYADTKVYVANIKAHRARM